MTEHEKRIYNKGFFAGALWSIIGSFLGITLAHIF
jgi:hypothetical protein